MHTIHATKKLRDRVKAEVETVVEDPSPVLGNWYATVVPGRPHRALFVNERIRLSVLVPLAPGRTLLDRFPAHLGLVLEALGADPAFVAEEVAASSDGCWATTDSRSMTGTMNEFLALLDRRRRHRGVEDEIVLSTYLAGIPCTPLYDGHKYPERELAALLAARADPAASPG